MRLYGPVAIRTISSVAIETSHFNVVRAVDRTFLVGISVKDCVQTVGDRHSCLTNHAQVNVEQNFSLVNITAIQDVTLGLHVLHASNPVKNVASMDPARTVVATLVNPA